MKKIIKHILSCLVALLPLTLSSQTQTENHVVTKTYKVESTTSLTTNDPNQVTTAIQYFDEIGRLKQSVLVKGGATSGNENNVFPYDWVLGNPNHSSFYNHIGTSSENQIVYGTTPFQDQDLLWECVPDSSSDGDGGWNTDLLDIDKTKAYRYTVWVKRTGSQNGTTYHGVQHNVSNLDGTTNGNPYYWSGDPPQLDTWYLLVGYVHPYDYTGGDLGISGVYDTNGTKVSDGTEFKWTANDITQSYFRSYLYYSTDTSVRQYFWNPVVQKIDGSESSLSTIINTSTAFNNNSVAAKDIVSHHEYDGFGRKEKEYLPYASNNMNGQFEDTAKEDILNYYLNTYATDFPGITDPADVNAFSETIFEDIATDRIVEQTAPGSAWKQSGTLVSGKEYSTGNTIKMDYEFNGTNEAKYFPVTISISGDTYTPSLGASSYYNAYELTKSITKDENWTSFDGLNKTTEEFKNKSGQVVLKRTYNAGVAHDTYYVYDDYGNLTYVLPPKASYQTINQTVLDELCYQYVYDHRRRLVEKKIPGKGWEYIVYDKLDRPVLTQDALQRTQSPKQWLFTKYDALGRVVYTGQYDSNDNRTTVQNTVNSQSAQNLYEDRVSLAPTVIDSENVYHTNRSFPTTSVKLFTVNYYDTYADLPTGFTAPNSVYGQTVTANTKGLSTTSKVRVLDPSAGIGQAKWITTVTYYDDKARPVYVYSKNEYLETTDIVESNLDFTGKVLETTSTHSKVGQANPIVTIDSFKYDHMDRLVNQSQKVNNQISERIVRNTYDDLGQLKNKLTGNGTQKGYTDVTSGMIINGDLITKTGSSGWNAGLATLGSFQADGYVQFTASQNGQYFMVGLSSDNSSVGFNTIDYAIYLYGIDNRVSVYESGVNKGHQEYYQTGDKLKVERIGNTVYYKKNGIVFYISEASSTGPLLGDISIHNQGNELKDLHIVDNSTGLQNVDYTYNVRGWLKTINDDAQNDNDLFNFTLRYNDPTSGTALFNGNISQTSWNTLNTDASTKTYTYSYDALNRITTATDNTGNYNLSGISYDKNGNILTLQRQGHTNPGATLFGLMDNLSYTYDSGNKLTKVDDASGISEGFKDISGTDYTYDVNGNMISDNNKEISSIAYNHLNLPMLISFPGQTASIEYVYDATGVKQKKKVSGYGMATTETEYAGNYIYEKGGSGQSTLQFFNHGEGYVRPLSTFNGFTMESEIVSIDYVYQYKDHLGNVRLTYGDSNNDGIITASTEIIEESNYYPFGLKHEGYNYVVSSNGNSIAQKFGYNGKEFNDELGLNTYDFGARNYYASLGRWMNIDPLAENMVNHSPYDYSFNNPIFFIDPNGMTPCPHGCAEEKGIKINEAELDRRHGEITSRLNNLKQLERDFFDWLRSDDREDRLAVLMYRYEQMRPKPIWTQPTYPEGTLYITGPRVGDQVLPPEDKNHYWSNFLSRLLLGRTFTYDGKSWEVDENGIITRPTPIGGTAPVPGRSSAFKISKVAPDWAVKGAHAHLGKTELAIKPTMNGTVVIKAVFSKDVSKPSTLKKFNRIGRKLMNEIRNNPVFRDELIQKTIQARDMLKVGNKLERSASGELNFLIKALKNIK